MNTQFTQATGSVALEVNLQSIARIFGIAYKDISYLSQFLTLQPNTKILYDEATQQLYWIGTATGDVLNWTADDSCKLYTSTGTFTLRNCKYFSWDNSNGTEQMDTTEILKLPLPYINNMLKDDVDRIRQSIKVIDGLISAVSPEAVSNPTDSDADQLQKLFEYMKVNAVSGILKKGKTYLVDKQVSISLKDNEFNLNANGAILKQVGNNTVVNLQNEVIGNITPVTSITEVQRNLGDGTTTTRVMKVVSPNHPFTKKYEPGKVFSDDMVPDAENSDQLAGEFFIVGEIEDANTFYTTGVFDETYSLNINVARPSMANVTIDGIHGTSEWTDGVTASFINLRGFIQPTIKNTKGENINAAFINITSCLQANVLDSVGYKIKNEPSQGSYGYFVNDSSSEQTLVDGISVIFARHAFTTTQPRATKGDLRWDLRGRSKGFKVMNGQAKGCDVAFDTHATAMNGEFINLSTADDKRGNDTGGYGIQIRANGMKVINCDVSHSKGGLFVSSATKTSESTTIIQGLKYRKGPQSHTPINISGNATYQTKVYISDSDIYSENDNALTVTNAKVYCNNVNIDFNPYVNTSSVVLLNDNASIDFRGRINLIGSQNAVRIVKHAATLTKSNFDVDITGVSGRLSYLAESASQYDIESSFVTRQDAALPGIAFLGYATTSPKIRANITVGFNTRPLAYRDLSYSAAGNNALNLQFASHDSIMVRVTASAKGVAFTSVTQGAFVGQRLTINNRNTSVSSIRVENNSTGLLLLGKGIDIPVAQSTTLIWDGSVWKPTSINVTDISQLSGYYSPEYYGVVSGDESKAHANSKAFYLMYEDIRANNGGIVNFAPGVNYFVDFVNFIPSNTTIFWNNATITHIDPLSSYGRGGLIIGSSMEWNYAKAKAAYESGVYPASIRDTTFVDPTVGQYLEFNQGMVQAENVTMYGPRMVAKFTSATSWGGYGINCVNSQHVRVYNYRAKGWTEAFNIGSDVNPSSPSCFDVKFYDVTVEEPDLVRTYYALGFCANSTESGLDTGNVITAMTAGTLNGSGFAFNATERCYSTNINIPNLGLTDSSEGVLVNNSKSALVKNIRIGNAKTAVSTTFTVASYNDATQRNIISDVVGVNCQQCIALGAKYAEIDKVTAIDCVSTLLFRNVNATGNLVNFEPALVTIAESSANQLYWYFINNTVTGWKREYIRLRPVDLFVGNYAASLSSLDMNKSAKMLNGATVNFYYKIPDYVKAIDAVTVYGNFSVGAAAATADSTVDIAFRYMGSDDQNTSTPPVVPTSITTAKRLVSAKSVGDGDFSRSYDLHDETLGYIPVVGSSYGVDNSLDLLIQWVNGVASNTQKHVLVRVWKR